MAECRTCEYCGATTTEKKRDRCPVCRLLVCGGCWDENGKCCVACITLAGRMLAVVEELDK